MILMIKKVVFGLVKSEFFWFLCGDINICFFLEYKNYIWDEWVFKKWVESDEYMGLDMIDFGCCFLVDVVFNEEYKKEKWVFC